MRELPELWRGADRIQWGCVLMRMLGESSLARLSLVLSGLRSVEGSRQVARHQVAVRTARTILGDLLTRRAVQSAVYDFLSAGSDGRSFDIAGDTLEFNALSEYDSAMTRAEAVLREGLPMRELKAELADSGRDLVAELDGDRRVALRLHGLRFPAPQQHDLARTPRGPITVQWSELEALAAQLDGDDATAGRRPEDWTGRLAGTRLLVPGGDGLRQADALELADLKHLIGLPGSGKTTLIVLLCVLLSQRRLRLAVFFTSIQVARQYLETLNRYGVRAALLVGRSTDTHMRHADQLAELVAGQGGGGFARTREGVELLAQSCALPAFADPWPDDWRPGEAPCERIYEPGSQTPRLCPAWSLCGRVRNQRELVHASVWLGHILSADTTVPAHTSRERLRYFELAARTLDLVIVDECDDAQRALDQHGALTHTLTGNDQSVHVDLQRTTGLLAANRARVSDGLLGYMLHANEFERHTLRFVNEIRKLGRLRPTLARRYSDNLLTANYLLREIIRAARPRGGSGTMLSALSDLWETAMYKAFFERLGPAGGWRKAERHAGALGLTPDEGRSVWLQLNVALRGYLNGDHTAAAEEQIREVAGILSRLIDAPDEERIAPEVRLLVAVGFTIASYQRLAKDARALARRGEIAQAGELVFGDASREMHDVVPRSILGTFSSVRYRPVPGSEAWEIDYLVMDSTPRLLLHRLHELGGASVLLCSATSWLDPSTAYHVGKRPDMVLSSRTPQLGPVRMYFQFKAHPVTGRPLRFSGARDDREDNLRHMVTALASSGPGGSSDLERAVRAMCTGLGRRRMAALVVNSYEQVRLVVEQIQAVNPHLGERTRGVLREMPRDRSARSYVLPGQVEGLGMDPDVDVIVFPLAALGRGTNVVFTSEDADRGCAAIGTVLFLTRPHPASGDLGLMLSLLARRTEVLDSEDLRELGLVEVQELFDRRRYEVFRQIARLLARPMSASQLDDDTLPAFAANLLVTVLQTIGRAIRNRMPAEVYFVDAAWAPGTAAGQADTARSSMLVAMRHILAGCLAVQDPNQRAIHQALYGVFMEAFRDIEGVEAGGDLAEADDDFSPSPVALEDAMDDWDQDESDQESAGSEEDGEEIAW